METEISRAGRVYLQCKLWLKGFLSERLADPGSKGFGKSAVRALVAVVVLVLFFASGGLARVPSVLQGLDLQLSQRGPLADGSSSDDGQVGAIASAEQGASGSMNAAKDVVELIAGSIPPASSAKAQKACLQHQAEPKYRIKIPPRTCKCGRNLCTLVDAPPVSVVVPMAKGKGVADVRAALKAAAPAFAQHMTSEALVVVPGQPGETVKNSRILKKELQVYIGKVWRSEPLERGVMVHVLGGLRNNGKAVLAALVRGGNGDNVAVSPPGSNAVPVLQNRRKLAATWGDCAGDGKRVSFLLEYFRRPRTVSAIGKALSSPFRVPTEVIIHDDSQSEVEQWLKALRASEGYLLEAGNVHEIRAYNRMAKMARGETIVLLQDDDLPPSSGSWVTKAASLFSTFPKLGLLGGYSGTIQGGPYSGKYAAGGAKSIGRNRIPVASIGNGVGAFMFVTFTNMGPFVMRRQPFLKMGLFNQNFSCRGEAGIGFDYEIGLRMWKDGYQVGLFNHGFTFNYGDSGSTGTRASSRIYKKRLALEIRNANWYSKMYAGFYQNHAPTGRHLYGGGVAAEPPPATTSTAGRGGVKHGQGRFMEARAVPMGRLSKVHKLVTEANQKLGVPKP